MQEHRLEFPVEKMAKVLKVSRSGFYAWHRRGQSQSQRQWQDAALLEQIRAVHKESAETYGSERVTVELRSKGQKVCRKRVMRLMRQAGLRGRAAPRRAPKTTDSRHDGPVAPNLLERHFSVEQPNQVVVSDITYIPTRTGWLYLCVFIDLFSRGVVGWELSRSLQSWFVLKALQDAVAKRRPGRGLIVHSDRGCQYACEPFVSMLAQLGFRQSMSRMGDCWDNAVAESFFHTLKTELIYWCDFHDYHDARRAIFEYIECFYNRKRLHSTLGYHSPWQFEQLALVA
jgi:transposase InsO family protein